MGDGVGRIYLAKNRAQTELRGIMGIFGRGGCLVELRPAMTAAGQADSVTAPVD